MICTMREPKSNYPRDLEEDYKIFARSTPEVFEVLGTLVSRVGAARTVKFKGRIRPKKAQVINAIILYFESLSNEEQVEAVKIGIEKLNQILKKPIHTEEITKAAKGPEASHPQVVTGQSEDHRPRKRRGAG